MKYSKTSKNQNLFNKANNFYKLATDLQNQSEKLMALFCKEIPDPELDAIANKTQESHHVTILGKAIEQVETDMPVFRNNKSKYVPVFQVASTIANKVGESCWQPALIFEFFNAADCKFPSYYNYTSGSEQVSYIKKLLGSNYDVLTIEESDFGDISTIRNQYYRQGFVVAFPKKDKK
jgi:hypothetical protein